MVPWASFGLVRIPGGEHRGELAERRALPIQEGDRDAAGERMLQRLLVDVEGIYTDETFEGAVQYRKEHHVNRNLDHHERQALARYTQDAGNHVSLEVHPAATLTVQ